MTASPKSTSYNNPFLFYKLVLPITKVYGMDIPQLFFERYEPLCNFYLAGIWAQVPYDLMRQRPNPEVNSIAWNLWHLARVEDAGLNRFVVDRFQVLDEGSWMERMNLPWRHHGSEMRLKDVDELDKRIDLVGLQAYSLAVQERTREVVMTLSLSDLDPVLGERDCGELCRMKALHLPRLRASSRTTWVGPKGST